MLSSLDEIALDYIFTTINDTRASSIDDILMFNKKAYKAIPNYKEALRYITDKYDSNDIVLITGSLHFISLVINFYKN